MRQIWCCPHTCRFEKQWKHCDLQRVTIRVQNVAAPSALTHAATQTSRRVKWIYGPLVFVFCFGLHISIVRPFVPLLALSLDRTCNRSSACSLDRSITQSLERSRARLLARSLGRSPDRSLDRSIARSIITTIQITQTLPQKNNYVV